MSFAPHTPRMSRAAAVRVGSLIAACGTAGLLVTAVTAVQASAADAAAMEVTPATGADTSGITLTTSAACPADATNLIVSVKGSGFPSGGQIVVGNSPITTYGTVQNGGIVVPLTQTMRDYANTAGFKTLQGRYDFTLTCRKAFNGTSLGDFTTPIWFTSNTAYRNTDPAGPTSSPTTTPTTTATTSATPSGTATPTDTVSPTDTSTPTDSASATDTSQPTDTASPTDTSTGGGSENVSTNVNGGASGGGSGSGNGSLAHTGANAGALGALSAALVLAGVVIVRRARPREDFPSADTSNS
ncbi:hypothetical protein ABT173_12135 [Streptomyces sp. NPDC001795]|uniref:hypothetical protein n=1 Tax=unclassified Streptomyces TaxID=2593676 RepID=UPI003319BFB1